MIERVAIVVVEEIFHPAFEHNKTSLFPVFLSTVCNGGLKNAPILVAAFVL